MTFNFQRASNDTYFKKHGINTALANSDTSTLENEVKYNFSKNNTYLDISASIYENLRENSNKRYEYVLPNILFGKSFFK